MKGKLEESNKNDLQFGSRKVADTETELVIILFNLADTSSDWQSTSWIFHSWIGCLAFIHGIGTKQALSCLI